jgi:hypothetical protein
MCIYFFMLDELVGANYELCCATGHASLLIHGNSISLSPSIFLSPDNSLSE